MNQDNIFYVFFDKQDKKYKIIKNIVPNFDLSTEDLVQNKPLLASDQKIIVSSSKNKSPFFITFNSIFTLIDFSQNPLDFYTSQIKRLCENLSFS